VEPLARAGQYYLLEKIAQGGMAEIFKGLAYDLAGIKKTVCIKKILPHIAASQEFIDMLVDEAKIAVKLSHGSIAQVYGLGKAGHDYFIVMEYVDGQSLSKIQKKVQRLQKKMRKRSATRSSMQSRGICEHIRRSVHQNSSISWCANSASTTPRQHTCSKPTVILHEAQKIPKTGLNGHARIAHCGEDWQRRTH
jgi:serine/threonine protein kinase